MTGWLTECKNAIQTTSSYLIYLWQSLSFLVHVSSLQLHVIIDITFIIIFTGLLNVRAKDFQFDPYFISFCVRCQKDSYKVKQLREIYVKLSVSLIPVTIPYKNNITKSSYHVDVSINWGLSDILLITQLYFIKSVHRSSRNKTTALKTSKFTNIYNKYFAHWLLRSEWVFVATTRKFENVWLEKGNTIKKDNSKYCVYVKEYNPSTIH